MPHAFWLAKAQRHACARVDGGGGGALGLVAVDDEKEEFRGLLFAQLPVAER